MRLRLLMPTAIVADIPVRKVTAEGLHGSFTLLPRHVDFLAALVPGLLTYEPEDGGERFAAVDGGLLVKYGPEVVISSPRAVLGSDLGRLRGTIESEFQTLSQHERVARGVIARLEADFVRRFLRLGPQLHG